MKSELQGEGSYTYTCDNPECCYCLMMGLKEIIKPREVNRLLMIKQEPVVEKVRRPSMYKNNYHGVKPKTVFNAIPTNTTLVRLVKRKSIR